MTWFQEDPVVSVDLLTTTEPRLDAAIIDVGGGASTLVDRLIDLGYTDLTVLDIAEPAHQQTRDRLGDPSDRISWVTADITDHRLDRQYDLWHDRAVFHFMTDPTERASYVEEAQRSVARGGHVVLASFALDGPERCSGLPVQRYDAASLGAEFEPPFELVTATDEYHLTPAGDTQHFTYVVLRRR